MPAMPPPTMTVSAWMAEPVGSSSALMIMASLRLCAGRHQVLDDVVVVATLSLAERRAAFQLSAIRLDVVRLIDLCAVLDEVADHGEMTFSGGVDERCLVSWHVGVHIGAAFD